MKPLKIKMQAFGSYQDQTIDFTGKSSGLFLITGDTGSGKTTIFDAIVYALYGKTSGGKRDGKMMRSDFAFPDLITKVEYTFAYGDDEYTIIRTPEQIKYKLDKKTGEYVPLKTKQSPSVELIMPDGQNFVGKIREIDEEIERIVGLNVEQFTQVAMLAQGDFMKLLLSSSKERKEIFSKIFDTSIYDMMEKKMNDKYISSKKDLDENQKDIERVLKNVIIVPSSKYEKEWNEFVSSGYFTETKESSLFELLDSINSEQSSFLKKNQITSLEYSTKLEQLVSDRAKAEKSNSLFDTLKEKQRILNEVILPKKSEIDRKKEEQKKYQKALIIKPSYDQYVKSSEDADSLIQKCIKSKEEFARIEKEYNSLIKEESDIKLRFDKEYPQMLEEADKIRNNEIPKQEKLLSLKTELQEDILKVLEQKKKEMDKEVPVRKSLEKELKEMEVVISSLQEKDKRLSSIESRLVFLDVESNAFHKINDLSNALSDQKNIFTEQKWYAEQLRNQYNSLKQEYELYYKSYITDQVSFLRRSLQDGKPCPVCGSIHHIYNTHETKASSATKYSYDNLSGLKSRLETIMNDYNTAIAQKKNALDQGNIIKAELDRYCKQYLKIDSFDVHAKNTLVEKMQETESEIKSLNKEKDEILSAKENIKKSIADSSLKQQNYNQLDRKIHSLEAEIKVYSERSEKVSKQINEISVMYGSLKEAEEKEMKIRKEADSIKTNLDEISKKRISYESDYKLISERLEDAKNNMEKAQKLKIQSEKTYHEFLDSFEFSSEEEFKTLISKDFDKESEEVKKWENDFLSVKAEIRTLNEQTESLIYVEDMDMYNKEISALNEKIKSIDETIKEYHYYVSANEKCIAEVKKLYDRRESLFDEYLLYKQLSDTANGKIQGKHLRFETYVQRRFFRKVIKEANKRLMSMSRGQFILKCRDLSELTSQGEVGLDLDVYSLVSEQIRDVKTLSGGESFLAALSMALGMADLIQCSVGKVRIDTVFIDEGFGSLDDDTINEAIRTLSDLSDGDRLVGIISHVNQLKAQVDTQLLVEKGDSGSIAKWNY